MKQRKKPCPGCPFSRKCKPGELGGSPVETYIGQAHAPFWLPCHEDANYEDKSSDVNEVAQCAGAAIFRANIGLSLLMPPAILVLPHGGEDVFSTIREFVSHHCDLSDEEIDALTSSESIAECIKKELGDPDVQLKLKAI